jgi:galactokinase
METADRLFRDTYGTAPEGIWESPGRVNLIGEHTDYNAGLVLPIALPQRTYVAARRRDDDLVRLVSDGMPGLTEVRLGDIAPGTPDNWARYPAGVLWALHLAGHEIGGLDLAFASTVPIGAGLSSSAAIEGATGAAASELYGLDLLATDESRARLAGLCQRAENEIALAPTGGMDQAASLRSLAGHALLLDCRDGTVTHQPFDLAAHGLALLVIDTRATHALVDGQYGERRASCEAAALELGVTTLREIDPARLDEALDRLSSDLLRKRTRHVVTEIARVQAAVAALAGEGFETLGRLFVASHTSLRDDFEVSCAELDTAVSTALDAGALGARMTGGGFGGSAIALVAEPYVGDVIAAVERAFQAAGFIAPVCFAATAAGGARRTS